MTGGEKVGLVGEKEIGLVKKEIAGPMTEWTHDKDNGYLRLFGGKDTHVLGYSKKRLDYILYTIYYIVYSI